MSSRIPLPENLLAVIFDLDGLILDSESVGFRVWSTLGAEQGFEVTHEIYQQAVGKGAAKFAEILSGIFGSGFDAQKVLQARNEKWIELLRTSRIEFRPGFPELLEFLEERQIPRAIASTTERFLVNERLRSADLDIKRFQASVTGDEIAKVKPEPDIYLRAAELLGVAPKHCLALEDTDIGATAANRAGIAVIIVPDLISPSDEARAFSVSVQNSLYAVRDILQSCLAA